MSPFGRPPQIFLDMDAAMRLGDMAKATALARLAIDQGHRHPVPYNLRAYWHEAEGRFAEAVADLEQALALVPGDPRIMNGLGRCLTSLGRFEDALVILDRAIALAPKLAAAHYNKGFALEQMAEIALAKASYETALKRDPGMIDAMARLASLAARRSDWDSARAYANKALAAEPRNSIALFAHVMADQAAGDFAQAERRARTVIADETAPAQARANAQSFLADALDAQNRTAEAFAAYEAANSGLKTIFRERFEVPGQETGIALATRWKREFETTSDQAWTSDPEGAPIPFLYSAFRAPERLCWGKSSQAMRKSRRWRKSLCCAK